MRRIGVATPFRLDLTAAILRRFSTRRAECEWIDTTFVCALPGVAGPHVVGIRQPTPETIEVAFDVTRADERATLATVGAMLGTDADLRAYDRAAASIPWLHELAVRMRGVKPARYASLWEAGANAIVFQSVSMLAAAAVMDRFIATFGTRIRWQTYEIDVFPALADIAVAGEAELQTIGVSRGKVAALRALALALQSDEYNAVTLERLSTPEICRRLCGIRGIGPWSAAVIALRGLGRLDVFPLRDSGVVRTVARLCGNTNGATTDALALLGESRGMLYHLLLLARLEARGILPGSQIPVG